MTARGLQPCPLTFGCKAEALVLGGQPDEALELIHSHANLEETMPCINTVAYTDLKGFAMTKRAKERRIQEIRHGGWEAGSVVPADHRRVDASICGQLLRHAHVSSEKKALRTLVHATSQPGSCGTLLVWHSSSREARTQEQENGSLLHAAAARGLVQVCARLLAAVFDVNVRCGKTRTRWTKITGLHWPSFLEFCPSLLRAFWHGTTTFKVCSLLLEAQAEVGMSCHAHPFSKSIFRVLQLRSRICCLFTVSSSALDEGVTFMICP